MNQGIVGPVVAANAERLVLGDGTEFAVSGLPTPSKASAPRPRGSFSAIFARSGTWGAHRGLIADARVERFGRSCIHAPVTKSRPSADDPARQADRSSRVCGHRVQSGVEVSRYIGGRSLRRSALRT